MDKLPLRHDVAPIRGTVRNYLILLLCLFFWGCNSSYISDQHNVLIAQDVHFQLINSHPFVEELQLLQSAQITYKDEVHDLLFQTEVDNQGLIMVGLAATGTRLFSIEMRQGQVTASGLPSSAELKPQYLLADMQLSLWPEHLISQALTGAKVIHEGPQKRLIVREQQPIISIQYSNPQFYKGQIHFQHLERGYSLFIEPLSIQESSHHAQ